MNNFEVKDNRSLFKRSFDTMFPDGRATWCMLSGTPLEASKRLKAAGLKEDSDYVSFQETTWDYQILNLRHTLLVAFKLPNVQHEFAQKEMDLARMEK
jgi:hypothetical protein